MIVVRGDSMSSKSFDYKGKRKKKNYFEGWYFKFVTKDKSKTISFIPGISLGNNPHSFIQVISSSNQEISKYYFSFRTDEFQYDFDSSRLLIERNEFYLHEITVDLKGEIEVSGSIHLNNHQDIKRSIFSPTIMGIFSYLPKMECIHEVVSMEHSLSGSLRIGNEVIEFDGGVGYIEKDRGSSFPKEYVWMQSNHFTKGVSFMFSYATIPYLFFEFKGLICNLILNGEEYRFATYNQTKIKKMKQREHSIEFTLKKKKWVLEVQGTNTETVLLKAPNNGEMSSFIKEGLNGKVFIRLSKENRIIYEGIGKAAGIEIMLEE
jgi:hypothetical protein